MHRPYHHQLKHTMLYLLVALFSIATTNLWNANSALLVDDRSDRGHHSTSAPFRYGNATPHTRYGSFDHLDLAFNIYRLPIWHLSSALSGHKTHNTVGRKTHNTVGRKTHNIAGHKTHNITSCKTHNPVGCMTLNATHNAAGRKAHNATHNIISLNYASFSSIQQGYAVTAHQYTTLNLFYASDQHVCDFTMVFMHCGALKNVENNIFALNPPKFKCMCTWNINIVDDQFAIIFTCILPFGNCTKSRTFQKPGKRYK